LVIVGDIFSIEEEILALDFLTKSKAPILLESISNLRGKLNPEFVLKSHDLEIERFIDDESISSIVRIGGVPTTSLWRKLTTKYKHLPVYNFSHSKFSGLPTTENVFSYASITIENPNWSKILDSDNRKQQKISQILATYPRSEAAMLRSLSKQMDSNDNLYLGNSLPIRDWDVFTDKHLQLKRLGSNRGANGIDGQLSSFIGFSYPHKRNIGLFGDLTTMYGLSAPWILNQIPEDQVHIFTIINNSGGQIFSRMYDSKTYVNPHSLQFDGWASFWRLPYFPMKKVEALPHTNAVVEIFPDPVETDLFWKDLKA
ncbi:MAG: hypothetical protein KDD37_10750, partial [Bdellovibrionales bacterium]|nr:hypothetical protein [Bdellovibrionales bacterium]